MKLRGACIHHDNGVIGAHTLDAAEDRRIRILKESGYNAIRSAHNPASRATLRACDRHGVLVMDELTDAWWRPKVTFDISQEFEEWWEKDLESMVAKDVNHPSVILYSIGNEIGETATERGIELNRRLADRTRELDPTRFVTNCINGFLNLIGPTDDEKLGPEERREPGDGRGAEQEPHRHPQLPDGRAGEDAAPPGPPPRRRQADPGRLRRPRRRRVQLHVRPLPDRRRKHPVRVIVGSETNPVDTVTIWREIENLPHVIGDFAWTGWDYIGEAGCAVVRYDERRQLYAPWPGLLAGTPVIDITGHRQTQSYLQRDRMAPERGARHRGAAGQPLRREAHRSGRAHRLRSAAGAGRAARVGPQPSRSTPTPNASTCCSTG